VVAPNPPKLGAVVVVVVPFAFPNIPLVVGAALVLPKEPELALPNKPPLVPFVGTVGAKVANGFAFGCSCCCCWPNVKPPFDPFPKDVDIAGVGAPPKEPLNEGAGAGAGAPFAPVPKTTP
jgi:hypothetical protein